MGFANPWIGFALNNAYANRMPFCVRVGVGPAEFTASGVGLSPSFVAGAQDGGLACGGFDRALVEFASAFGRTQADGNMPFAMFREQ